MAKKKQQKKENKKEADIKKENHNNEKSEEKVSKKITKAEKNQMIAVIIVIIILFASFFIPYYYIKNQKVFEYAGVTWQVEKETTITWYHTQFQKVVNNRSYGTHNTYLRNDPRKNTITYDVDSLSFFRNIAISSSKDVLECDRQILVTDAITQITAAMPLYNKQLTFGIIDEDYAQETGKEHITCQTKPDKTTVIEIKKGQENRIYQDAENKCYILEIKNCEENVLVGEKFVIEAIRQLHNQ